MATWARWLPHTQQHIAIHHIVIQLQRRRAEDGWRGEPRRTGQDQVPTERAQGTARSLEEGPAKRAGESRYTRHKSTGKGPPRIEVGLAHATIQPTKERGAARAAQPTARPVRLAPREVSRRGRTIRKGLPPVIADMTAPPTKVPARRLRKDGISDTRRADGGRHSTLSAAVHVGDCSHGKTHSLTFSSFSLGRSSPG